MCVDQIMNDNNGCEHVGKPWNLNNIAIAS